MVKTREDNKQFEKNYRASINNNHQAAPDDERTIWLWNHLNQESLDARIMMVKEQIADNDSKLTNYLSTT